MVWEPLKSTELHNHPWRRDSCGSKGVQQRSSSTSLEQKFKIGHIAQSRRNSLTLSAPPFPQGNRVWCQEIAFWPMTSPVGEVRVCECVPDFPSCAGCYQIGKRFIFLSPQPEYWVMTCTVNNWKTEARAQQGTYQGDMDLIKQFRDSIRRQTHEPVGTAYGSL